ncbi:nickel ABC transporter permease [Chryseomicrobium palamuruense]|uniref:Nickel import system permease protein NikB n=1 Tax=Chryseomicrobium palamuruense TaxID=682973 RepID=A0ABV8UTU2_9BACL
MGSFIMKRAGHGIVVLFGISVFSFLLIHLIPGDPARMMLGDSASAEQIAQLREQLGLNQPLVVQYMNYLSDVIRGDFGTSFRTGRPVLEEILIRFPETAKLALAGMTIAILVGVTLGILAAHFKDSYIDQAITGFASLGLAIPSFWLGLMLIMIFSVTLGWLPVAGGTGFADLILPSVTLGVLASTVIVRLTRSGMIDVLSLDFIRTAKAKGLGESAVLFGHAFRNAMIPVVTVVGLQIASLLGGTVIIEQLFNWPGLGTLSIGAITTRDFPLLQGTILFIGIVFVTVNIMVDLLYGFIDPRIKMGNAQEGN